MLSKVVVNLEMSTLVGRSRKIKLLTLFDSRVTYVRLENVFGKHTYARLFFPHRLPTPNDQNMEKPADYRPPVPPHRTQLNGDDDDEQAPPPPPKRHHHHHHHHRNRSHGTRRLVG